MQRILQPGEIEALDRTRMPHARLPQPASLFRERAARLLQQAEGNPIGDYLRVMARIVQAQAELASHIQTEPWAREAIAQAQSHAMPLCNPRAELDAAWHGALAQLLARLTPEQGLPAPMQQALNALGQHKPEALQALAARILDERMQADDLLAAPIVMAALQLHYAHKASQLQESDVPYTQPMTICPVCGSQPVASVLRIGGAEGGLRFLHCSLCCTEWHMVRIKCSHCESTGGIRYQGVVNQDEAHGDTAQASPDVSKEVVLAETCDHCHSYRKIVNQEKDPHAEPLADDLASMRLDLLMGQTDYARASANPLLALGQR
ncbi:formate dehydrogenase accessory protein FdhE [Vandammella animalimorsus]|uniref:Protein FdhE homolog n=1 Tax=Vandammella animalimorsus TaxID=2029117 RepID=A0A3M6RI36_9BURK|nr:formate dehydrogenase accessory protein FdhE [Vandammella animalimorsus]RMX14801.1 formate dehydrogenase accessory protein FdhE [Vandammella animalimorsus]